MGRVVLFDRNGSSFDADLAFMGFACVGFGIELSFSLLTASATELLLAGAVRVYFI